MVGGETSRHMRAERGAWALAEQGGQLREVSYSSILCYSL
jgi:hypothetical protein